MEDRSMGLRIICIDDGGAVRLASDGPITSDMFFTAGVDNPLEALLGAAWSRHRVLLDLRQTEYIDSSAVGWLLNSHKAFVGAGGRLVLHSVQPKVRRILTTLRIDAVVPLAEDEPAARLVLNQKEAA
jgi:anti-anti-sigma factor